ncbi:MAG: hypothetical protein JXR41_00765 [Bacteroidales bacterium]|nr:hypothetical protein [Bacteroidales bacterium]
MKKSAFPAFALFCGLALNTPTYAQTSSQITTPTQHFGFTPGTERMLFNYQPLVDYLMKVDEQSERVKMIEIGKSPMGRKMYICFVSTAENIENLDLLREINKTLALDSTLTQAKRQKLAEEGKVFILATHSMHSTEVGPAQSVPLLVHRAAIGSDTALLKWLEDVVYMVVPNHNPDGMDMVVDHYNKYKGTKYEGCWMPGLYHKYVGHDNNRDFVTLTQEDNKIIARIFNKEWYPQVLIEKHQMGSTTARYFVPPNHDPITENIDERMWNWTWVFGSNMAKDMTAKGLAGVSQHYLFDDYWPGATETAMWKNVISLLTECASVSTATSIFIEPNELTAVGKGLSEYKKSINMPMPWEGGWWKLSDIIDYELVSAASVIKTAAFHKSEILHFRNEICRKEIDKGRKEAPYYYVMPRRQHDPGEMVNLLNLLDEHGIAVFELSKDVISDGKIYVAGDYVIPLAHPFRAFIKEVMEAQDYPERHYTPGGELIKPYDITSWSLPLHRGVTTLEMNTNPGIFDQYLSPVTFPLKFSNDMPSETISVILPASCNESFKVVFKAFKEKREVKRISSSFSYNNKTIEKGSFLIPPLKQGSKPDAILNNLTIEPIFVTDNLNIKAENISLPRIALIESIFHDMDAGWTRFVFDQYNIPFTVLKPGDLSDHNLQTEFDVLIFPDQDKDLLMEAKRKITEEVYFTPVYPPDVLKGIGKEGLQQVLKFVDAGGIVVSWGESTGLFMGPLAINKQNDEKEEFQLPCKDISEDLKKKGLYCPGSLLQVELLKDHPLTYGMPEKTGVFSRGKPVFATSIPYFDMDRRVIGTYPEKDILLSGYIEKEEELSNKPAIVWLKKGKGQLVLFSFNPQFRASTAGTYKLLFNSLLL